MHIELDSYSCGSTGEGPDYEAFDRARLISELNCSVDKALKAGITMKQIEAIAHDVFKRAELSKKFYNPALSGE